MKKNAWMTDGAGLLAGIRLGHAGVWRWKIGSGELEWTENLAAIHGLPPSAFDGTIQSFQRDLHPHDAESVWQAITAAVEEGNDYRVVYRSRSGTDDKPQWIEATGGVLHDEDGCRYLTGICVDATARVRGEFELARRLRQQEEIGRLGTYALGEARFERTLEAAVNCCAKIFDAPLTKILQFSDGADHLLLSAGVGWKAGLVGTARVPADLDSQAGYTLASEAAVVVHDLRAETRFAGPQLLHDHGVRSGMSAVIAGEHDRPFGVLGVHAPDLREFDSHDVDCLVAVANIVANAARQHRAVFRQELLLREMAHRSGNLLQVVASVASQTLRAHPDRDAALRSFSSRLDALSRANHLLARSGWTPTRLSSLVHETLKPFEGRIEMRGPDVVLPADLTFDLGLVLHELATNSAKYGSLAGETGTIELAWRLSQREDGTNVLELSWNDPGASRGPSTGVGFGSRLKRTLIEGKWNGVMNVENAGHYRFSCSIPLPSLLTNVNISTDRDLEDFEIKQIVSP